MEEWISVKDRLPVAIEGKHYSVNVLVFEPYCGQYVAYLDYNKTWSVDPDPFDAYGYECSCPIEVADPDKITHWRHLGNDPIIE